MAPVVEGIRFLVEVGALVAVAAGAYAAVGGVAGAVAALVAVAAVALVWGRWVAPKSPHRLADPTRLLVELALFGIAGLALWAADRPGMAIAFVVVATVTAFAVRSASDHRRPRAPGR